ncbi:MAG: hypothetical protein RL404_148 [Pseudomonadota bacterium]
MQAFRTARAARAASQGRPARRPRRPREKGVVAILVGITILVMVAMVGLAIDLGQMYIAKTELQNSADACALAGVGVLAKKAGAADALTTANSAATLVAGRHKAVLQDNTVGGANSTITVQFAKDNIDGPYQSAGSYSLADIPAIKHVRCQISQSAIKTFFIQVLDLIRSTPIGDMSVSATAVGKMIPSQLTCALPVAICQGEVPAKGHWMRGVIDKSGDLVDAPESAGLPSSSVKWVDFSGSAGGASEITKLLTGDGECTLPVVDSNLKESGVKSSVAAAYNSRFGIYQGGIKTTESAPDFSGYAYTWDSWVTHQDARTDYLNNQLSAHTSFQGDVAISGPTDTYTIKGTILTPGQLTTSGRDRRLMSAPVVDCTNPKAGLPLKSWACIFMLNPISNNPSGSMNMWLEYLGPSTDPDVPCASNGVPGGAGSAGPFVPALVR